MTETLGQAIHEAGHQGNKNPREKRDTTRLKAAIQQSTESEHSLTEWKKNGPTEESRLIERAKRK